MLEKEALAIIFGVKKFHQFLYGHLSTIKTDPKADNELLKEFTFSCRKKETATVHTLLKVYGVV